MGRLYEPFKAVSGSSSADRSCTGVSLMLPGTHNSLLLDRFFTTGLERSYFRLNFMLQIYKYHSIVFYMLTIVTNSKNMHKFEAIITQVNVYCFQISASFQAIKHIST